MRSVPTIVLLHFFGSSHREWTEVRGLFGPDIRIRAFDLPGFGDASTMPPADAIAMADHVDRCIVDAGLAHCVVVGHSMSAKAAMVLAARAPDYLRGLVLLTASPPSPEPMSADARAKLLAFDGSAGAAAAYVDGLTARPLQSALRHLAIEDAMDASLAAWTAWVTDGSQQDLSARVGTLDLPTLVVAGAQDRSLGEDVQRTRVMPNLADGRLVVIDGGHALPLENPVAVHREIAQFVASLQVPDEARRHAVVDPAGSVSRRSAA